MCALVTVQCTDSTKYTGNGKQVGALLSHSPFLYTGNPFQRCYKSLRRKEIVAECTLYLCLPFSVAKNSGHPSMIRCASEQSARARLHAATDSRQMVVRCVSCQVSKPCADVFPADGRSELADSGVCAGWILRYSTQLGCYRAPVGFGCAASSWCSSLAPTGDENGGSEDLQGLLCLFLVFQGSFRSFSRTAGLRVGSSVWVRVCTLFSFVLTRSPSQKE
jgi:hypothetical protein